MNGTLQRQNSMKCVISLFSEQFMRSTDKLSVYEIMSLCGVGSNGFVLTVKSLLDHHHYALKILNLSYYLAYCFKLDLHYLHESVFDNYADIAKSIANTAYFVRVDSKKTPTSFQSDAERKSFRREFEALQSIPENNSTVYLFDYGTITLTSYTNGCNTGTYELPYIVMPLFHGITLTDYLSTTMSLERRLMESLSITEKIIDIVDFIHQNQVIHRDLFPNNFLYDSKSMRVALVDFGSALVNFDINLDSPGERRGARRFMPPEQFLDPSGVDFRSDYFFIGAVLFNMLTLTTPFARTRNADTLPLDIKDVFTKPDFLSADIYHRLTAYIKRLMCFSCEDRYQTIEPVRNVLLNIHKDLLTSLLQNENN